MDKIYGGAFLPSPQVKQCEFCENDFTIHKTSQLKIRFCGRSCSAKWRMRQPEHLAKVHNPEVAAKRGKSKSLWYKTPAAKKELDRIRNLNPMKDLKVRQKMANTLKAMNHRPSIRGGNGHGMTVPQKLLKDALVGKWIPEYALSLGKRKEGYPTNYKIDLANLQMKIAIEVDGNSHHSRKKQDKKKDKKLASLGWKVLRFWNKQILEWIETGKKKNSYISTTLKSNGIKIKPKVSGTL